jgi:hypothetical protein
VVLTDRAIEGFPEALWRFVRDGGYAEWRSGDGVVHFYRFVDPQTSGYPHMLELFARHPDFELRDEEGDIAPLPFDEDISSLSAILLDDDYYGLISEGLTVVDGISIPDEAHLIPLKMRAHIDLNDRAAAGQHVNGADLNAYNVPINTQFQNASVH